MKPLITRNKKIVFKMTFAKKLIRMVITDLVKCPGPWCLAMTNNPSGYCSKTCRRRTEVKNASH